VILKSYIIEKNLNVLDEYDAVLLYGENDGIKADIKIKIKSTNKDSEIINFFEDEIIRDRDILYKNIVNESLFNEKKIIFLQSATDKIYNEVCECLEKINRNTKIYIFTENLDKKSKLRNLFEKKKNLAALGCYEDNQKTLINYISKELETYVGLSGEFINLIVSNSNYKRRVIQTELVKIKNFFKEKKINKTELLDILNIKNDAKFDEIRDNSLIGRLDVTNKLLSQINILDEDTFLYLGNLNYRIIKLIEIQKAQKIFGNHEKTLENLKPPIFWKDKPIYLMQVKKWNLEKLRQATLKINETEILMKKNSHIRKDIIFKDLIVYLTRQASISC
jgi:DNA polymerase-3 subunit delta